MRHRLLVLPAATAGLAMIATAATAARPTRDAATRLVGRPART
jgi:hypothetical protein